MEVEIKQAGGVKREETTKRNHCTLFLINNHLKILIFTKDSLVGP